MKAIDYAILSLLVVTVVYLAFTPIAAAIGNSFNNAAETIEVASRAE